MLLLLLLLMFSTQLSKLFFLLLPLLLPLLDVLHQLLDLSLLLQQRVVQFALGLNRKVKNPFSLTTSARLALCSPEISSCRARALASTLSLVKRNGFAVVFEVGMVVPHLFRKLNASWRPRPRPTPVMRIVGGMEQHASYDRSTEGSFNAGFGGKAMNHCEKWLQPPPRGRGERGALPP